MPMPRKPQKHCADCGGVYPLKFTECPNCASVKQVQVDDDMSIRPQVKLASQASSIGEALVIMNEQHLCGACAHLLVCQVGRLTCELALDEKHRWLVTIGDCTEFAQFAEEENEEEPA